MSTTARISAALFSAIAASALSAQDARHYQVDLAGGWSRSKTDTSPDLEINQYRVGGTYHLKPVALADHPWSEAAFLEHSTSVSALLGFADFDVGSFSADGMVYGAGFRYADKETPVAAELNFSIGSLDGDGGVDIDLNDVNARVGYWLKPNVIVGVEAGLSETEANSVIDVDTLRVGLFGKLVRDLGDGTAVNGEAHFGMVSVDDSVSTDENVEFGVAGDFYFTPQYSVGALVDFSFGDAASEEGTTLGVRGTAWFSPRVALNLAATTFDAEDSSGVDQDTFAVFVNLRF